MRWGGQWRQHHPQRRRTPAKNRLHARRSPIRFALGRSPLVVPPCQPCPTNEAPANRFTDAIVAINQGGPSRLARWGNFRQPFVFSQPFCRAD
jgi:hypothetical protein